MGSLYCLDQLSFKVLQLMNETGRSLQLAEDLSEQNNLALSAYIYMHLHLLVQLMLLYKVI